MLIVHHARLAVEMGDAFDGRTFEAEPANCSWSGRNDSSGASVET